MTRLIKVIGGRAFALSWLLGLSALNLGFAGAACTLQARTDLPAYQALADTTGTLTLNIICDQAAERYALNLLTPVAQRQVGGTLAFQTNTSQRAPLRLLLLNAATSLTGSDGGLVYQGSRQLEFPIVVPAGQWSASGQINAALSLQLQPLTSQERP